MVREVFESVSVKDFLCVGTMLLPWSVALKGCLKDTERCKILESCERIIIIVLTFWLTLKHF